TAEAVLSAHRKGHDPETISAALGQELIWVKRHLRLAGLHPEVFAAFVAETISFDQAAAYAATADQALQLAVFQELQAQPFDNYRQPHSIRAKLKVGDRDHARLLRIAGAERYRAAGGGFEFDLFADDADQRGRVMDEPLLRQLVDEALAATKQDLRERSGRKDLRFVTDPPRNDYGTDY
ncbi:hypothetical protein PYV61_26500, partial [Roseisolibacter sp. H3M3-2]